MTPFYSQSVYPPSTVIFKNWAEFPAINVRVGHSLTARLLQWNSVYCKWVVEDCKTVCFGNCPTPVVVSSYSVKPGNAGHIAIRWETASEINIVGFELWRHTWKLSNDQKIPLGRGNGQVLPRQGDWQSHGCFVLLSGSWCPVECEVPLLAQAPRDHRLRATFLSRLRQVDPPAIDAQAQRLFFAVFVEVARLCFTSEEALCVFPPSRASKVFFPYFL